MLSNPFLKLFSRRLLLHVAMGDGHGLKLEKIEPTLLSFNAMAAKITNKFKRQCTVLKFVSYVHNSAGAFCVRTCASIFSGGLIDLSWVFFQSKQSEDFFVLYHLTISGNFQGSETWHRIFWGFDFCPHSTIPVT